MFLKILSKFKKPKIIALQFKQCIFFLNEQCIFNSWFMMENIIVISQKEYVVPFNNKGFT